MNKWEQIATGEYNILMKYAIGNGIDVACCARVFPGAVGIDIISKGQKTQPWGLPSAAQFAFDCSDLPFKDETLDFIVGVHTIEHFADTKGVLNEWIRILKVGGYLLLVVPDIRYTPSPGSDNHDITHLHEFEPEEFLLIVKSITGTEIIQYDTLNNEWSFDCVLRKKVNERNRWLSAEITNEMEKEVTRALEDEKEKEKK